ncbi:3-oxo-5-alpha-steroid 4-dehydrogenase 2 [Pleurostoma richardsiae]|uniref:3-oxo-5-alpha-steroid 4-dehydrogenase 2 n=1 Tax=Pleurostoma richardsiae TaxID=41990 RepID=A0AA38R9F4_9PEZI|nr:3-oxo-5-alpha-steroid 4-dehydrogenase 2 [Pleurostoma richardsiae]
MAIIQNWLPPTRENYNFILFFWQLYPLFPSLQWLISWYGMGKTSVKSVLNLPGRIGWMTMECPGFLTLLYIMKTLPAEQGITDLPWQNKVLAGLFVIHYTYRAVLFPWIQPSMSPIHIIVWFLGLAFQLVNATCLGSWLAAYGPTTPAAWASRSGLLQFSLGIAVFYLGLAANYVHDDELREIRRREQLRQEKAAREDPAAAARKGVEKHYQIPTAGLFRWVLYPHYLAEWVEWAGFYLACGLDCVPARMFLLNEIAAMLPRAVKGKKWYEAKFGEDKIKGKWAVIPGVL